MIKSILEVVMRPTLCYVLHWVFWVFGYGRDNLYTSPKFYIINLQSLLVPQYNGCFICRCDQPTGWWGFLSPAWLLEAVSNIAESYVPKSKSQCYCATDMPKPPDIRSCSWLPHITEFTSYKKLLGIFSSILQWRRHNSLWQIWHESIHVGSGER